MNFSNNIQFDGELCIPLKSFTSDDIYYINISLDKTLDKIKYNCTCGNKYGVGYRTRCKHISHIKLLCFDNIDIGVKTSSKEIDKCFIPINSIESGNVYCVTININKVTNKVHYECTCGSFYGTFRDKCKHISYVYINLLKNLKSINNIEEKLLEDFCNITI